MTKPRKDIDQMSLMPAIERTIDGLISGNAPVDDGMLALIAIGQAVYPSLAWRKLLDVPWNIDGKPAEAWLRKLLSSKSVPRNRRGIWVGAPTIYMNAPSIQWCFFSAFKRDDTHVTWASKPIFPKSSDVPDDGPFPNEFTSTALYNAAKTLGVKFRPGDVDGFDVVDRHFLAFFTASIGFTCLLTAHLCRTLDVKLILGSSREVGVTAGFAEGGHHQLGILKKTGWMPRPRCEYAEFDDEDGVD